MSDAVIIFAVVGVIALMPVMLSYLALAQTFRKLPPPYDREDR